MVKKLKSRKKQNKSFSYTAKGKNYEAITPKWNKNLTFYARTRKYKGELKTELYIKDKKRNEGRHYITFTSKNKKVLSQKLKGINANRGATIKGNKKGESYSLVGTEYNDISPTKFKVKHTETLGSDYRKQLPHVKKGQQIWIHAEMSFWRKNTPRKKEYGGTFYGYSRMGGTEQEAINHLGGQCKTANHLGSGDRIEIERVIGKGFMSYDR